MPKYRVSYVEREVEARARYRYFSDPSQSPGARWNGERVHETGWEEEVDAPNSATALETFFREHAGEREKVLRLDRDLDRGVPVDTREFEPDETYLWIEGDKLMEYEGIEAMTFGRTTCPLCLGKGGIDHALADYYFEHSEAEA